MQYFIEGMLSGAPASYATGSWNAANRALYTPVIFPCDATLYALNARSNSATGNYDLGLYDPDMNRIASKGSTANAAAKITLTLPEVRVYAGYTYWQALVFSSTSSFYRSIVDDTLMAIAMGLAMEDSALPLPATMTPVLSTTTQIPLHSFGVR